MMGCRLLGNKTREMAIDDSSRLLGNKTRDGY